MGMDLIGSGLSYSWYGWRRLVEHLEAWGTDISELRFSNDGDPISKETCSAIADALEAHLHEFSEEDRDWIEQDIDAWRSCNGCSQW